MKVLLVITSVIALAVTLMRMPYSEAKSPTGKSASDISMVMTKTLTDQTIPKTCSSVYFSFREACSDKYINSLNCSANESSETPVFTLGELRHYLCALEVKLISKQIKKQEPMLSSCSALEPATIPINENRCN